MAMLEYFLWHLIPAQSHLFQSSFCFLSFKFQQLFYRANGSIKISQYSSWHRGEDQQSLPYPKSPYDTLELVLGP